jgi:type III restriction enzyme
MQLKSFQDKAVRDLVKSTRMLLSASGMGKICVFKSPTGSGKTIMMADFLGRLPEENLPGSYVYVWSSLYDLHNQSKAKISRYLGDSRYSFLGLEDMTDDALDEDSVLFVNWHSLTTQKASAESGSKDWSNLFVKDREDGKNIVDVLEKTRDSGRELVLIVDEAHRNYLTVQTQQFINEVLQPKLIIEVSATPQVNPSAEDVLNRSAAMVPVLFNDVVASGLIKQETLINPNVGKYVDIAASADDLVLQAALAKRLELQDLYKANGIQVNPLVLVQLPSEKEKTSALDVSMREAVEAALALQGITVDNNKLAIWLSEEKTDNLKLIEKNLSEVEVLIFKEAVAVGWDCPRAQILVMLRDIKSLTFEIQTVGRVLRMPEASHYDVADLNKAYVFSNVGSITVNDKPEELDFFKNKFAKKKPIQEIELPSVYLHRQDYGDLTSTFSQKLVEVLNRRFQITNGDSINDAYAKADKELELYSEELKQPVVSDVLVRNLDDLAEEIGTVDFGTVDVDVSEANIEARFRWLMKAWCLPYAPARSYSKMIRGFYQWFSILGFDQSKLSDIQRIITCSIKNQGILGQIVEEAKIAFEIAKPIELGKRKTATVSTFRVPEVDLFGDGHEEVKSKKYALEPCYLSVNRSQPERAIEKVFEESDQVLWWYKNGENRQQYFSIPYETLDTEKQLAREAGFYPDYIVLMKDGTVGIYETKSGATATERPTFDKSDALQAFISVQKKTGMKVTGGIVNSRKEGLFVYEGAEYTPDVSKWERLSL